MDNNKVSWREILTPVVAALLILAGILVGRISMRNSNNTNQNEGVDYVSTAQSNKLTTTLALIDQIYVDSLSIDSLAEKTMPDLMSHLDPHSVYIPAADMGDANEALDGEFDGIGVVFNMATDTVVVLNVIRGGPSFKAGIQPGDRIVIIDKDTVAGRKFPQNDVVKRLRGLRNTKVNVKVLRGGIKELIPFEIVRDKIPVASIDAAFMLKPEIGYVKLSAFARNSAEELSKSLADLSDKGMKSLIFDLRDNAGGFLDQAIAIANMFLDEGQLVVYTMDRNGSKVEEYCRVKGTYADTRLVVLINESSASSSEILAGALQDNDRGTVVGRRSFGKGLVQRQIPFTDGSAIRLTVARYYTPTGRSIQKPYSLGGNDYDEDMLNRLRHDEFFSADSIVFDENQKFTTKGGKTVYGGGGIMPDVFVPMDTTGMTRYYTEVWGRNILYRFTLEYSDRHRRQINNITTIDELKAFLDADKTLLSDFVAYARKQGVEPVEEQIEESKAIIVAQLRAYVGRNTELGDSGFIANIYPVDNTLQRAVEELRKR